MADFFNVPFATSVTQKSWSLSGSFPIGTDISVSWTGAHVTTPCGQYGYAADANVFNNTSSIGEARFPVTTPNGAATFRTTEAGPGLAGSFFTDGHCSGGTVDHVAVSWSTPALAYCQYGTRPQASAQSTYYLTPALIAGWLAAFDLLWLAPAFAVFWYTSINVADLCAFPPPPTPVIDLSTLNASIGTLRTILQWIAWGNLCECLPGTPAPIPYPPPSATEPPGWPTTPTVDCSNANICATLVSMSQQLASIQQVLAEELGLTTLLQRHRLPFAFIRGAAHAALSGTGSLSIPTGLIGLQVNVSGDTAHKQLFGVPPYVWDLGWLSVSDGGAMLQEKRLTRDSFTWFPQEMELANRVGYALASDITIDLVELEPEP